MGTKTVWVECQLKADREACYFPGHNIQQATAKALEFFRSLSIPREEFTIKDYVPRKKIITPRRRKKMIAKRVLTTS